MLCFVRQSVSSRLLLSEICNLSRRNISKCLSVVAINQTPAVTQGLKTHNLLITRYKSKGKGKHKQQQTESDSQENEDFEAEIVDKNTKVMKINVTSLRLDGILKNSLGIARNKIETMFYESKIRVNGEKVTKKSSSVKEGDEIDIIKGVHQNNPNFLTVARVEILSATANEDDITLKVRRCKSLMIDNYTDKWQVDP